MKFKNKYSHFCLQKKNKFLDTLTAQHTPTGVSYVAIKIAKTLFSKLVEK